MKPKIIKLKKFKVEILLIILFIVILASSFSNYFVDRNKDRQISDLKSDIQTLSFQLDITTAQRDNYHRQLIGSDQYIEQLVIQNKTMQIEYDNMYSKYLSINSYALVAEEILKANGIIFNKTE